MGMCIFPDGDLGDNTAKAFYECRDAMNKFPEFNSAHEGFAVLKEEVDELWEQVRINQSKRDNSKLKKECIQVAAMALRFATEICDKQESKK